MTMIMRRRTVIALLLGAVALPLAACSGDGRGSSGDAAGHPNGGPATGTGSDVAGGVASGRGSVPIDITAEIGGEAHRARGNGECTYAEEAYIRGVPSKMWQVQYRDGGGGISHTNLTVWRPNGGGVDQLSLIVQTESGAHRINTVVGSEPSGSGVVMMRPEGDGIHVTLDGSDAEGTVLRLTIVCARVTPAVAEGG